MGIHEDYREHRRQMFTFARIATGSKKMTKRSSRRKEYSFYVVKVRSWNGNYFGIPRWCIGDLE